MSNPSLIWATLSAPNPAAGSIPFILSDSASVGIDATEFYYSGPAAAPNFALSGSEIAAQLTVFGGVRVKFTDASGVAGNANISTPAGRVKFVAGTNSLVVTNPCCFATSIIKCGIEGAFDATAKRIQATPGNGSFTLTLDANATGTPVASFEITNVF